MRECERGMRLTFIVLLGARSCVSSKMLSCGDADGERNGSREVATFLYIGLTSDKGKQVPQSGNEQQGCRVPASNGFKPGCVILFT